MASTHVKDLDSPHIEGSLRLQGGSKYRRKDFLADFGGTEEGF